MKPKNKTPLVIFVLGLVLGGWDIYCMWFSPDHWTVSKVMVDVGMRAPFVVFILGMCTGHFFFRSGEQT